MKKQKQKGIALIQVIIVVALVSVIAASLQFKQKLSSQKLSYNYQFLQLQQVTVGLEDFAKEMLWLDSQNTELDVDTEDPINAWQFPLEEPQEVGYLAGAFFNYQIEELSGRFNVNLLSMNGQARDRDINKKLMLNMLTLLAIEDLDNSAFVEELYEWFDPNSSAQFRYSGLTPSYLPGATSMADLSELLLLESINKKHLEKLRPFLSARPVGSKLNINYAPREILFTLTPNITAEMVDEILNKRSSGGITNLEELAQLASFEPIKEEFDELLKLDLWGLKSDYFEFVVAVEFNGLQAKMFSTIERYTKEDGTVQLNTVSKHFAPEVVLNTSSDASTDNSSETDSGF